ncbi:MAG: hypothetical protein JAZ02_06345 [Candidatus Thiodiazotropha endolucinida]|nr:hypothetical protein [Candidatus Thiodiazotropha endolucinida]
MSIADITDALRARWPFPGGGAEEYLILLEERDHALYRLSRFRPDEMVEQGDLLPSALVSKSELRLNFDRYAADSLEEKALWWKTTSGTSGRPVDIPYDAAFYLDFKYAVFHKVWRMLHGESLADKPYLALVISDVTGDESRICIDPIYSQGVVARLSIDVADEEQVRAVLLLAAEFNPDFLSTKPSVLAALVCAAPDLSPRAGVIIVGGAALSAELREETENRFGGQVVSLYATSEVGVVASECAHGRLHIFESDVKVTDSHPDAPSEIVVTSQTNSALPLSGYRTGDIGAIACGPCACGSVWRWIERLEGRVVPLFRFASGEVLSPTRFNSFLRQFPTVREFQVTLIAPDELEIRIEHLVSPGKDMQAEMEQFFANHVPEYVRFRFCDHIFDQNEKFARFRVAM